MFTLASLLSFRVTVALAVLAFRVTVALAVLALRDIIPFGLAGGVEIAYA
jgi:hypothetical protein